MTDFPGIEITTRIGCKNACVYCPQKKFINNYRRKSNIIYMSFDTFKACLDKLPLNVQINFSGFSEPWLNPDCTKMVLFANEKGYKIAVFTTMVGMNISDIDLLEQVSYTRFLVHLPAEKEYDKIQVDGHYLDLLKRTLNSKINVAYHFHGVTLNPKVKLLMEHTEKAVEYVPINCGNKESVERWPIFSRAGNVKVKNRLAPFRKRGALGCKFNLRYNVLLPNGDVLLCCMDYGMKHVLGNLLSSSYDSLFFSGTFLKAKAGLRNGSLDTLCRYCERVAYDVSLFAKVYNYPYYLNRFLYYLRTIHNFSDLRKVMHKTMSILRK